MLSDSVEKIIKLKTGTWRNSQNNNSIEAEMFTLITILLALPFSTGDLGTEAKSDPSYSPSVKS